MNKRSLLFMMPAIVGLLTSWQQVQVPLYVVLVKTGNCQVKHPNQPAQPISGTSFLQADDLLIIGDQAEADLLDGNQKLTIVDRKGTYPAKEIPQRFQSAGKGISRKFYELFVHDIFKAKSEIHVSPKEQVCASWGAGERTNDACNIELYPVDEQNLSADSIRFNWNRLPGKSYDLVVFNQAKKECFRRRLTDTSLMLNAISLKVLPGETNTYYYAVSTGPDCPVSAKLRFFVLPKQELSRRTNTVLSPLTKTGNPLLDELSQAEALGQAGLLDEAYQHYRKAINLAKAP